MDNNVPMGNPNNIIANTISDDFLDNSTFLKDPKANRPCKNRSGTKNTKFINTVSDIEFCPYLKAKIFQIILTSK